MVSVSGLRARKSLNKSCHLRVLALRKTPSLFNFHVMLKKVGGLVRARQEGEDKSPIVMLGIPHELVLIQVRLDEYDLQCAKDIMDDGKSRSIAFRNPVLNIPEEMVERLGHLRWHIGRPTPSVRRDLLVTHGSESMRELNRSNELAPKGRHIQVFHVIKVTPCGVEHLETTYDERPQPGKQSNNLVVLIQHHNVSRQVSSVQNDEGSGSTRARCAGGGW